MLKTCVIRDLLRGCDPTISIGKSRLGGKDASVDSGNEG
jgi:hypothetical protein